MKMRNKKSMFWEYLLICTALTLITCISLGALFGTCYLRTINNRNRQALETQASHALTALDNQLDSMQQLALRFSTQRTFRQEYVTQDSYTAITTAQALSQYSSYCTLAEQFCLIYPTGKEQVLLFQSDGTTADLPVFLNRYGFKDSELIQSFLFEQTEQGRIYRSVDTLLIAYTIPINIARPENRCGILCFAIPQSNLEQFVQLSSALSTEEYSLSYKQWTLITNTLPKDTVTCSNMSGFILQVGIPNLTLMSLLTTTHDVLWLTAIVLLLFVSIFALAWRLYRPIRALSKKYPAKSRKDNKNELLLLDQLISQIQNQSVLLDQKASSQSAMLRDYVLLMLLNNSGSVTIAQDLAKVGIQFPYPHFAVITLTPCKDQLLTQENMETLQQCIDDISEDAGVLQTVECSSQSHILAIICNIKTAQDYDLILQRLHTYLNAQVSRFLVGSGPLADTLAGVSASYLTALSKLRESTDFQLQAPEEPPRELFANAGAMVSHIISQIERGDHDQALLGLEAYMSAIGNNPSELVRRYNAMNITCAIQQLCTKLEFQLTETQMGMLLSMRSVDTIHFALKQLIPSLCIYAQAKTGTTILSTEKLVMDYLHRYFCNYDISVQQISEAVGIGINRASAIIREETGHSFKTVLTQLRIEHAKKLLSDGMSVSDVADQVGYGSASYFIKVFKASEGITPDAYRKNKLSHKA